MKPPVLTPNQRAIRALQEEVTTLSHTLATLIAWMAESANSPIRQDEAEKLLSALTRTPPVRSPHDE